MKPFKIFFLLLMVLISLASFSQGTNTFLKKSNNTLLSWGREATVTTTDSTLTALDLITVASNEAGIVRVTVLGYDATNHIAVTGVRVARYNKASGTLTLGTPTSDLAPETDAGLGTATWTLTTSSNNILVQVKGKAPGYTIKWVARIERIYLRPA